MLKASDIMTPEVALIRGSATVAEAVHCMKVKGVQALIVNRRHPQDAYGIVTETDIIHKVAAFGRDPRKIRVWEIMTKPCIVVNPDLGVEYVARLFVNTGIRQAPVIQKDLLGIISLTDILTKSDFIDQPKAVIFEQELQQAIQKARQICSQQGHDSIHCKEAWQRIEEMQAEIAHQQAKTLEKTALEEYVEEYPEAMETLLLDNWCSG